MKTDIRIINGNQIGGCITVISTETAKIVIDFGESLPGSEKKDDIEFDWGKERVDAVFFTHYHGDHIGRFMEIPDNVPLYMGEVTYNVMLNIWDALSSSDLKMKAEAEALRNRENIHFLIPNKTETVGDIKVTPYSVDHSAFDAYMFLINAYDEFILHTGDYRDHGHRGQKKGKDGKDRNIVLEVIEKYILDHHKRKINVLITEGTMLTRLNDDEYSEKQMLVDARQYFADNKYIFLKISSTNADSLATFAKAAKAKGMKMYVSSYLLKQIDVYRAAGSGHNTNMYAFENVIPFMPNPVNCLSDAQRASAEKQRWYMRKDGFVIVASEKEYFEDTVNEFSDLPVKTIYSLWKGYLDKNKAAFNEQLYNFYKKQNAKIMHTSGHAYPRLIADVINLVEPTEAIFPIHTEAAGELRNLDIKPELKERIR